MAEAVATNPILAKLAVKSRGEAAAQAMAQGLFGQNRQNGEAPAAK